MSMEGFFLKPKNIAKIVTGAAVLIAASGEVKEVQGCDENSKTIMGQTSANKEKINNEKSGLDFFETAAPKQSAPGICFVGGIKKGPIVINKNAAPIAETTNLNGENDNSSEEVKSPDRYHEDKHGNVRTQLIGEKN